MFMLGITLYELTTCMDLPTGGLHHFYMIHALFCLFYRLHWPVVLTFREQGSEIVPS